MSAQPSPLKVKAGKEFPDFEVETLYEIVLPVYKLRVVATVMQASKFSVISRFVLRAVSLGVKSVPEIVDLLGISNQEVEEAGGELLHGNLIQQVLYDGQRTLSLTSTGEQYLNEDRIAVPRRRSFRLHYDPLGRDVLPADDNVVSVDRVRKEGLFTIPVMKTKPTLADIKLEAVRNIAKYDRTDMIDVVEILKIDECYITYRPDITALILRHQESSQRRIAVFKGLSYLASESTNLQRLMNEGVNVIPSDIEISQKDDQVSLPTKMSDEEKKSTDKVSELMYITARIRSEITTLTERRSITQEARERAILETNLRELEIKYEKAVRDLTDSQRELNLRMHGTVKIIPTETHRLILIDGITKAKHDIIIVSPWMDQRVVDDELCKYFNDAFSRGVRVRIAWGLGLKRNEPEAGRSRVKASPVIKSLRTLAAKHDETLLDIREANTHEKILVCDSQFCAWGSFNWLSYRGEVDTGYRRESSYYSERPEDVKSWTTRALELFPDKTPQRKK